MLLTSTWLMLSLHGAAITDISAYSMFQLACLQAGRGVAGPALGGDVSNWGYNRE